MKRVLIIALFSLLLIAPNYHNQNSYLDKLKCDEVIELYNEMSILYHISVLRTVEVKTKPAQDLWKEMKIFTLRAHPLLEEARARACKAS